jgi:glycosyltransferase 2 family protein
MARGLATMARVGVTAGAAWLVFGSINWLDVIGLLARANIMLLSLAALVAAVQFAILVFRWQAIIEMLSGEPAAGAELALALGRSMLFSHVMPSTVGGDVVRVVAVAGHTGAALAARSVICDRILGLALLTAIVVAILPFFASLPYADAAFTAVATVSFGGLVILLLLLASSDWLSRQHWIGRYPATIAGDFRRLFTKGSMSAVLLLMTLATHLLSVLMIYDLAHALAASVSFLQCLVIVPPALLISAVPISLGGWGVREGALATGFVLIGASSEAGVAASVLFGLSGFLIGLIAELAAALIRMRKITRKDMA